MNIKLILSLVLLLPSVAISADYTKISTGFFMSEGLSSTSSATNSTLTAVPILFSLKRGRFSVSLSSAVARITNENKPSLSDPTLSVSFDLTESPWWTAKIKHKFARSETPTALSTGKDDTSYQLDYFKIQNKNTSVFATLGYKVVGKVAGENMQDTAYASLGLGRVINKGFNVGASLDYRQAVYASQQDQVGFSVFADKKLSESINISTFGSYDDSDTLSVGATISYRL